MRGLFIRLISTVISIVLMMSVFTACGSERTVIDPDSLDTSTIITGEVESTETVSSNVVSDNVGDASSDNTRWGVTNTKKMPNFIKKIDNNVITVITSSNKQTAEMDVKIDAFKQLTGIDIKFDYIVVPWGQIPERVASMVMAGSAPDMFTYSSSSWLSLMKQPYWDDLNTYIDFDDALWKDVKNTASNISTYNGKRVAYFTMGYGLGGAAIIYNTKLVEDAADGDSSLYDPLQMYYDGKWTWSALKAYVEEISDPEEGVYGIALPDNRVSAFVGSTGNDIIKITKDQKLEYNLENKDVIRAFNYVKDLIKISDLPGTWQGMDMALNNTLGFYYGINGAYELYGSADAIAATKSGKLKAVPCPRDDEADVHYASGLSDSTSIPLNAKNPWLAAAWMYFDRYMYYNPNSDLQKTQDKLFKETYGWPEDLYMLVSPERYTEAFKNVKITRTNDVVPFGERLSDFDQSTYWGLATNVNILTSAMVEQVGPNLKTAIARYNSK